MRKLFLWAIILFMSLTGPVAQAEDCVVLLHGLARSHKSMNKLEKQLQAAGYQTVNHGYKSTKYPIEELVQQVFPQVLANCGEHKPVHFVTHSMGGILVRYYLQSNEIPNLGRVVMLGPPNQGSEVVDKMKNMPGFKMMNGPAGMQLGTDSESVPKNLGPASFNVGVVAGTRTINLVLSTMLPNPDDGKVSVESTRLDGMTDHISIPASHPFLMKKQRVIDQVLYYLEHGNFLREDDVSLATSGAE